jgi:hypothetical protein
MVIFSYLSTSFDTIYDYLTCSSWFIFLTFFSFVSCALLYVSIAQNLFQNTSGAKSAYYHGSSCFLLIYLCRNVFLFLFMFQQTAEWVWGGGCTWPGGEGGCTCILCIPPGYATSYLFHDRSPELTLLSRNARSSPISHSTAEGPWKIILISDMHPYSDPMDP